MANKAKNKYSMEADDFGLPPSDPMAGMGGDMGGMGDMGLGGGMDMGMGSNASNPGISHASNGLFPQDVIPVRGAKRLARLIGISFQANRPKTQKEKKINLFSYTPGELKYQPGFMKGFVGQNDTPTDLYNYLASTSQRAAAWERESKSANILSPEIEAAKDIMVASILSPVDLQTDAINVEVDDKSLPEEVQTKLSQVLSDYINNELRLSQRLAKWIGNAMYQTGATPIMILPQSNIKTLQNLNDLEYAGMFERSDLDTIRATTRPGKAKEVTSGESLNPLASFETLSIKPDTEEFNGFVDRMANDCLTSIEALDFISKDNVNTIFKDKETFKKDLKEVIDKSKNFIRFSTNISTLTKHRNDIRSKLENMQREIDKEFILNKPTPLYVLNSESAKEGEVEAPTLIELPYQSVVPVIVPGAPDQHIGYFVLVNQWGEPINPDNRDMNDMNANGRLMESNMHAMFGVPSSLIVGDRSPLQHFKITSAIFGNILRHFMERKLEEYGLGGTQIQQHEAITTCLMRNMLDSRRIGLIFVPEPMMVYYCFDVHQDGTGKSLIEDLRTITGLRTTLVTANIMAATENSIDQKVVELNVGEMNASAQQLMEQVKNALTEKRIMRYDNNPLNVQRDLIQKSLTIVPKGIKGLGDALNVQTSHKRADAIGADETLLTQLSDWLIQGLKVPKSILTKTGEEEFARSVVTTNLFFNNRVKIYQRFVNEKSTKLIRTYIKYSTPLQEKILKELTVSEKDYYDSQQEADLTAVEEDIDDKDKKKKEDDKEEGSEALKISTETQAFSEKQIDKFEKEAKKIRKEDTHPPKSKEEIETNKTTIKEQLQSVLDHVYVKLPEPHIVVDKAQIEEINSFSSCIDQILTTIYSDDLLPDDYSAFANVLRMFRAREKSRLVRDFVKRVGFNSTFDLPPLDQLDTTNLYDVAMFVINQKKGMDNLKEQVSNKINLGNRVQNEGMMDTSGGMDMGGGDMGMGGDMETTGGENTLGGLPDLSSDMNMESGTDVGASAPAEPGAAANNAENGGMPDINI